MAKTETDAAGLVAYRLMVKGLLNTVGTMLLDSVVETKPREPKPEVDWAIGVVANTPPTKGLGRAAHVLRTEVLALRKELEARGVRV